MFGLKPARRWQPAFHSFRREKAGRRFLAFMERAVKGPVFGCRMCGNCLLQETAFICPMECPKGMRNGPCGGITREKKCYVDETRKCVWYAIYSRAYKTGRQDKLLEVLPPMDWNKAGCETWSDVIRQTQKVGTGKFFSGIIGRDKKYREEVWESVFRPVRQPSWWNGDSEYHAPSNIKPASELERKLKAGEFVVATELSPPSGTDTSKLIAEINDVRRYVTAINFTDSSSARPKMSSFACSEIALRQGAEPVLQMAARDITRTSLQAAATGLSATGIKNILCITGDSAVIGSSPTASMNIFDLDSVQMLWILRRMRDEGIYLDGRKIKEPPTYFLGAATSPFSSEPELQAIKDVKKVNAGAQFFQTNLIFEPGKLDPWLEQLDKRNVLDKVYILAGISPLKSLRIAEYLDSRVPGVRIPKRVLERMSKAGDGSSEEGLQIALELVDSLKNKQGIKGIHIMTLGWEAAVPRILKESGLIS
ncbi:MAG TPA: methylenetetrahydrofolate reductase C-terminal domain-containing protein [Bacteroidales bacterium]|nr:methylenetetrahydrofolate reductase C-terminal domain-containing protein [Bacteroidales bacterium]